MAGPGAIGKPTEYTQLPLSAVQSIMMEKSAQAYKTSLVISSVADPGCLSRNPDPDFYPSQIPDPRTRISDPGSKNSNKKRGEKKFGVIPFHVATYFTKL
jgi:hypothetical protein